MSQAGQGATGPAGAGTVIGAELRARAQAWIADDPYAGDQAELRGLLADGGAEAAAELADRFGGRLEFGTAGLRGVVAAGPNRMNRAVVRGTTAALAAWLREHVPGAADAGVAVGCDARHRSDELSDEVARVLAGAGIRVHLLPRPCPTPLLAFAVRQLATSAGVMITASHNPAPDNGYKLYLGDGAQIVPPVDTEIEAAIAALGPLSQIPVGPPDDPRIVRHGPEVADAYLIAVTAPGWSAPPPGPHRPGSTLAGTPTSGSPRTDTPRTDTPRTGTPRAGVFLPGATGADRTEPVRVVYTAMHGVAGRLMLAAIARAGFAAPEVVAAQAEPDPDFPTVAFPNPEEPGALDLAIGAARRAGADLVLASDPDGDRLAVAVPDPAAGAGWRRLTGDQLGALLGAYLLEQTAGDAEPGGRLVVTTIVSSTLLSKIAAAAGARYAETLTGFKWIVRGGHATPGGRFLFGYEEALGYAVGSAVRDKDGIGAALAVLGLATREKLAGRSLADAYDRLETGHGVYLTTQLTLRTEAPGDIMSGLRAAPPAELGNLPVLASGDLAGGSRGLPPADALVYWLPGSRIVIRPSGTEPKLKVYFEATEPVTGGDLTGARRAAADRLGPLRAAVQERLGG
ncbi:MAG TPA: phospho-sugar mutase [Streptosporangiaceae bacterium]